MAPIDGCFNEKSNKGINPNVNTEVDKIQYVVSNVEGSLKLDKGQKVIFAGDCTSWKGDILGQQVSIESSFKRPCETDEKRTKSNDLLLKTVQTPGVVSNREVLLAYRLLMQATSMQSTSDRSSQGPKRLRYRRRSTNNVSRLRTISVRVPENPRPSSVSLRRQRYW